MKRFSLFALLLLLCNAVFPAWAQQNSDLITLNDATPGIDVVITLPADSTGTIALSFEGAAVRLLDANGTVVFTVADPRLHGLELNIVPNSGSHTLTVERLPGVTEAFVKVASLPELTQNSNLALTPAANLAVSFNQEVSLPLSVEHPGDTVQVSIPAEAVGVLTTTFSGATATTQLLDAAGVVIAQSSGGHIDGMNFMLDSGEYQFTLVSSDLTAPIIAGVSAVSAADAGFVLVEAPASAVIETVSTTADSLTTDGVACTALVTVSSSNLRSGPGTGYSVLGYGYRGETLVVGGQNPQNNWIVVGTDTGSAWVAVSNVALQGSCAALTVFNIPLRDAQPAPLVITTTGQTGSSGEYISGGSGSTYQDDDSDDGGDDGGGDDNGGDNGGEHEGGDD